MTLFQGERRQRADDSRLVNVDFQNSFVIARPSLEIFWVKPTRDIICARVLQTAELELFWLVTLYWIQTHFAGLA